MTKHATCIGSRNISKQEKELAFETGKILADKGFICRSGNANGADKAFQRAFPYDQTEVFLPWDGFNEPYIGKCFTPSKEMLAFAKDQLVATGVMPWLYNTKHSIQRLHGRNYFQVVGRDNILSNVCVYFADEKNGEPEGGTRTAVMLCRHFGVPTFNLRLEEDRKRFEGLLNELP